MNFLSFTANVGTPWTSPFLPKLNGHVDPNQNPLQRPITLLEESWISSLYNLGALCGLFFIGITSEKLGQKMALICFSIPILISNILLITAHTIIEFYIARFLLGVGSASVFTILPLYVAEIIDVHNRGKAGMVMPLTAALSHIAVVSVGPYVTISTFACLSLIPTFLFYIIFVPFVPESPYYLVKCNKMLEAEKSLKKLRKRENVKSELLEIVKNFKETKTTGSFKEIMSSKTVKKSLIIGLGLTLCSQLTGAVPVTAYQQEIFSLADNVVPSHISVIIVGIFQLFATILVLSIIDKVGRKKLFLYSYIGLFLSLITLGIYFFLQENDFNLDSIFWLPLVCIIIHQASFRLGAGPVCWTVVAEIFPSNLKGELSSIVAGELVMLGFITSMIYPLMTVALGVSWTFLIFGGATGLSILFTWLVVPEIKGKSFLEIQEILNK